MNEDYTPTTEVIRDAVAFPRERLGEPRPISREVFDRWLAGVKAEARLEAAQDFALTREKIRELKAEAWSEGYLRGVEDERTAATLGYPALPNRNNPYREEEA